MTGALKTMIAYIQGQRVQPRSVYIHTYTIMVDSSMHSPDFALTRTKRYDACRGLTGECCGEKRY